MNQTLVDCHCLGQSLCSVVGHLIACQMERLQSAVLTLEVLGNGLTSLESNLVGIEVKHSQACVYQQVFHYDVDAIVAQQVFLDAQLLQAHVVLKHLAEVDSHTLANGLVHRIVDVQLIEGLVRRVEHRQNSNDSIVIDLVVAKAKGGELDV